jgi:hypothetical protein
VDGDRYFSVTICFKGKGYLMGAKKRLSDLYVVGAELTVSDGTEDGTITVWLRKLNNSESQDAIKRANAARSVALAVKNLDDSAFEKQVIWNEISDFDRDSLIEFLVAEQILDATRKKEEEIASEPEWAEEDYLEGLRESWESGLKDVWISDSKNPEASRVFNEIKKFTDAVDEAVESERKSFVKDFDAFTTEELQKKVFEKRIQYNADLAWITEYRKAELFHAVKATPDYSERYFDSLDEVESLDVRVIKQLMDAYAEITVEASEGKG